MLTEYTAKYQSLRKLLQIDFYLISVTLELDGVISN